VVKQKNRFNLGSGIVSKRLGVLVITLTLLVVPIALYFTLYISSRTSYLTNRDFRQLASVSIQLEDRIKQLNDLFVRGIRNTITDKNASRLRPQELFQQHLGNKKTLEADTAPETKKNLNQRDDERITKQLDAAITIRLVTGGETSTLYFIWPGSPEFPAGAKAKTELDEIVTPFIGKRSLESRKGSEHEEGFDAILIASVERKKSKDSASDTGVSSKIIFQQGSSDLDIDSLDSLANADVPDKTIDVRTLSENSTLADVRLAGTAYKIYSQPIEIPLRTAGSEIAIGSSGSESNANGEAETRWVVCGLVQASHFRHEAWAFQYTWLIAFVFATVVIFLSWPILKLQFIGPKDRLKLADVYWIGFSLLVGSVMLTFFLVYVVSYTRSEAVLDHQLEQTSFEINARFQEEVTLILKELSDLKNRGPRDFSLIEKGKTKLILTKGPKLIDSPQVGEDKYANVIRREILNDVTPEFDVKSGVYPYFRRVAWIDKEGEPRLEWTTSSNPTLLSIKDRDFFKRILDGSSRHNRVYEQTVPPELTRDSFWLEPIASRLTAEKIVVVSSSIKNKPQNAGQVDVIVLGDVAMMSLMRTIVPSDFSYRVVDNSGNDPADDNWRDPGKVLFQSSESQQSKENFFEECDNNHSLRSLVFGRATSFADLNYKGESQRVFIRPMDGFPNWSLVVSRNKQPLITSYLQILTISGFIFLAYIIILLFPLTIVYLSRIRKHNRTEWIWPAAVKTDIYRKTGYAYLLLCALSLSVILGLVRFLGIDADRWTPIVLVSLIAFTGILVLAFRAKLDWPLNKLQAIVNMFHLNKLLDRGNAYVWNVVTLLVLLGILPAVTFYKVAYNEEMKLFAKRAQLTLAQRLEERYRRVKTQYTTERADWASNPSPFGDNSTEANKFIDRRLRDSRDVYTDFWTQRSFPKQDEKTEPDPGLDGLMAYLITAVPSFNETSVETGGLTLGKAADELWEWRRPVNTNNLWGRELPSEDNLIVQLRLPGVKDTQIFTQLQRFGRTWQVALLWMVFGFAIIILVLFLIARFVVRRVFLLDFKESLYLPTRSTDDITQNVFLVQTSPFAAANGSLNGDSNLPPYDYIDLVREGWQDEWLRKLEAKATAGQAPAVVVDHFEFRMNDHAHNEQKLRLIKTLLAAKKLVVIKSSHLPSTFSFRGAARDALKRHANQSSESWAEVMTHFARAYETKAREEILREAITELSTTLNSAKPEIAQSRKDRALEVAELIRNECAGSTWLANIGKEVIESLATQDVESHYIFGQLMDRTELVYNKFWNNCSNDEKLTLLHLAQDGLLSYHDPEIEPLMQRGLIVCAPNIRLMNETFKAFVLEQCFLNVDESVKLQSAETQAKKSSYVESFQVPVIIGFVGVVLFLSFTQKDLFSSPLTLVTAATTGIPTVFKLLSLFQGDNSAQKVFNA
jgi:hypothetical protein